MDFLDRYCWWFSVVVSLLVGSFDLRTEAFAPALVGFAAAEEFGKKGGAFVASLAGFRSTVVTVVGHRPR